jgi:hypothetical protein
MTFNIQPDLRMRFERTLRQPIERAEAIGGGYTPALRLRVHLRDGSSVFIKSATTGSTAKWLRQEYAVYAALDVPFMPRMIAWDEGDDNQDTYPFLVLEDLSSAFWPPPWTPRQIDRVVETVYSLAQYSVPGLCPFQADEFLQGGWQAVVEDPRPFLSLGFVTERWLDQALPVLLDACRAEALQGDQLIHTDVRSDNVCFDGERVVLIDWNWTCLGKTSFDLASFLPSLETEGGPPPDTFLPHAPEYAAFLSGYWAGHAGLPTIPNAPRVREIQRRQLESALPWAVRALGLAPLDGVTK